MPPMLLRFGNVDDRIRFGFGFGFWLRLRGLQVKVGTLTLVVLLGTLGRFNIPVFARFSRHIIGGRYPVKPEDTP